jgi:hypothetical protein
MAASTITLRNIKGSPLTNTEMDTNISLLNSYSKGHLSKTITTNVTLTDIEAENYFFNISGTLTADATITIPSILIKSWTVNNITSGGFSITVKYATGAGITIQNGTRSTFYFDGTNMLSISYSNTVRISDTGTVTNTMLASSTISGVSLGSNLNALTIGTGLSGTTYNGSSAVTIAIDSTVATLTGSQTLTNKTLTSPVVTTSLTTTNTSFALLNATATTVNFAGAATTLTMGASTGTSTVNNDLVVSGNLTVNGTTTTINTATLSVDDKNLELGSVQNATISATGTVGTITGTGPWAAIVTGMTTTTGLIVGSSLSATVGTGSLGGSGSYIITSIDSKTQVSYSATGGTTPVAGTITAITTTGYNNITANGAGITVKGTTDKTLNWVSSTTAWTSSENLDIAPGKSYSIAGTSVLSSTTLGSGVTASSLTSVGTLVNPAYSGTLTGGTGIINIGSGQIYKDASGNVGIGTSSITQLYSAITTAVAGNLRLGSSATTGFISFGDQTSATSNVGIWRGAGGNSLATGNYLQLGGYDGISFTTGNASLASQTERLRIDSSGNVGIGYAIPANTLHVANGVDTQIRVSTPTNNFYFDMGRASADGLFQINGNQGSGYKWLNNGTEAMRISAAGYVGIGTTSPGSIGKLVVSNTATTDNSSIGVVATAFLSTPTYTGTFLSQGDTATAGTVCGLPKANLGSLLFQNVSAGLIYTNSQSLIFGTAGVEALRINTTQDVSIPAGQLTITNANNTATGGGQLYLNGATGNRIDFNTAGVAPPAFTTRSLGTKIVLYPGVAAAAVDFALGIQGGGMWLSVSTTAETFRWYGGTTIAATLSGAGDFEATANITAYSDERLKENIKTIPNALNKVNTIRGVTFTRNDLDDKEKVHTGVIAQEVLKVLPEAVSQNENGIYSVAYGNMVGLLIESIKELSEQNQQLLKRIEALENK